MECFCDKKPVSKKLLCDTIKNLLDIEGSQFTERVVAMPLLQKKREYAKSRLEKISTVTDIRKCRVNYQTNIFNIMAELPEQPTRCPEPDPILEAHNDRDDDQDQEEEYEDEDMHAGGELTEAELDDILGCNEHFSPNDDDSSKHSAHELTDGHQLDDMAIDLAIDDTFSTFVPKKTPSLPRRPDPPTYDQDSLRQGQCIDSKEEGSLVLNRHADIAKLQKEAKERFEAQERLEAEKRLKQKNTQARQTTHLSSFLDSSSDESSDSSSDEEEEATSTERKAVQVVEDQTNKTDKTDKNEMTAVVEIKAKRNKVDNVPTHKRKRDEATKTNGPTEEPQPTKPTKPRKRKPKKPKPTKPTKPRKKKTKKSKPTKPIKPHKKKKKTKKQSSTQQDDLKYFFQFMRNLT
jgi:hypothetical protein